VDLGVEEDQAQKLFANGVNGATLLGWAEKTEEGIESTLRVCGLSIGAIGALTPQIQKLGGKLSVFFYSLFFFPAFSCLAIIFEHPL
jgi:hypothetical protein